MGKRWKSVPWNGSAMDALHGLSSGVSDLAEQMGDWRDNMEAGEMSHVPKYEEVEETASALEDTAYELSSLVEAIEGDELAALEGIAISASLPAPYGRKRTPRWMQLDQATIPAAAALDEWRLSRSDDDGEVETLEEIETLLDELSTVNFPSMYG